MSGRDGDDFGERRQMIERHRSAATEAVAAWSGATAKIWAYRLTLNVFTVRLQRDGQHGNLHVLCGSCRRISGPTSWNDAHLAIDWGHSERPAIRLFDMAVGFEIVCAAIDVIANVDPVYW